MGASPGLGTGSRWLIAAAAAAAAASTIFLQPLLGLVATDFSLTLPQTARIGAAVQLGYGAGVLLSVPLGDRVDRRRLVAIMMAAGALMLALVALSPSVLLFALGSFLAGVTSSVVFTLIPYVASLAPPHLRGRQIGQVMMGSLMAIPISWVAAGWLGQLAGWRSVYLADALLLAALVPALLAVLPAERRPGITVGDWGRLVVSLPHLLISSPTLRERSVYCFLNIASFVMFWTGLPLLLASSPYGLTSSEVGLFGLVAVPGALLAATIGRLADRGHAQWLTLALAAVFGLAWLGLAAARDMLPLLISFAVIANVALMGLQVTNQSVISAERSEERSRRTAVYIFCGLIGATAGATLAGSLFTRLGWIGLCIAGAALPALLIAIRLVLLARMLPGQAASIVRCSCREE